ncbi:MAG: 4-(cytidine 5'-diphospho)-2-C-methyl-D-erythritol kinase [Dethiobacteria bacterium]
MRRLELEARAKINLTLDLLYKRSDGYHEVEMVMQQVELSDIFTFTEQPGVIELTGSDKTLSWGKDNLIFKAVQLLQPFRPGAGVKITVEKRIPVGAGLAGGSSDAAQTLIALNRLWGLELSTAELCRLGAELGSDVPFCIAGGTALAQGRGERLTPLPPAPLLWVVLAKPKDLALSTAAVYAAVQEEHLQTDYTPGMVEALHDGDAEKIVSNLGNALEKVVLPYYPQVAYLKKFASSQSGTVALMSGSGPTVFVLLSEYAAAKELFFCLKRFGYETWLTRIYKITG